MLKFKFLGLLVLSYVLQTVPIMASAEMTEQSDTTTAMYESCKSGNNGKMNSCIRALTLKDFAGAWTFGVDTVGGVSGAGTTGASLTIDGQVFFNNSGLGAVNFASGALYVGIVGSVSFFNFTSGATMTITISDPINGIGTLAISDPSIDYVDTADIVVIRSKSTGKVIQIEGHGTQVNPQTSAIATYSLVRQYQ